jgi:ribosomal protein L31
MNKSSPKPKHTGRAINSAERVQRSKYKCRAARFQLSKADRLGCVLISIDVAKLDRAWQQSHEYYIDSHGLGATEGRLERFESWLAENPGAPIDAPAVYLSDARNWVRFVDGRHRFAVLRNHGYRTIKIAVLRDQANQFRKHFRPDANVSGLGTVGRSRSRNSDCGS